MKQMKKMKKWLVVFALVLLAAGISGGHAQAEVKDVSLGAAGQDSGTPLQMYLGDTGKFVLDTTSVNSPVYAIRDRITKVTYSAWDWENNVQVAADGSYTTKAVGDSRVEVTIMGYVSDEENVFGEKVEQELMTLNYYVSVTIDCSGARLAKSKVTFYRYDNSGYADSYEEIAVLGVDQLAGNEDAVNFSYVSSNKNTSVSCYLENGKLHVEAYAAGETTVTITLGGKQLTLQVHVIDVKLVGSNSRYVVKGKKTVLKVKNAPGKIRWKSSNPKVAKISSKGKLTAKKTGTVVITASVGKGKIGCIVSVVTKKRLSVIRKAIQIGKTCKYSQAKRMQSGFYDCSSLVWKAYSSKEKKYFGDRHYAPTAANNAKWCADHHKIVKGNVAKNVQKLKYQPGALVYRTGDDSNGRYKGIYHVEMFIGYSFEGFDSKGKALVNTRWANRSNGYAGYGGGELWAQP